LFPIALTRFDVQNARCTVRITDRPGPLVKTHVLRQIAIENGQRPVVGLPIRRVEWGMKQYSVQVQTHSIEGSAPNRELRRKIVVRSDARQALYGTQWIIRKYTREILALVAFNREFRCVRLCFELERISDNVYALGKFFIGRAQHDLETLG